MGKFHKKQRGRQINAKKKIADKKRKTRRERKKLNAGGEVNTKKPETLIKELNKTTMEENRAIRAKNISEIQKTKRSNLHMLNRITTVVTGNGEALDDVSQSENPEITDKFNANQMFKNYYKEFKKVVEAADVVIEVLDARDPLGSRCQQIEQSVISAGSDKRLILLLNKIDLIPKENLEKWLKYLRQELPTVAFKASTQSQNQNLSRSKVAAIHMSQRLQSSNCCIGASYLMKVLGNYCRNKNILTSIRVGVVGYPNVGKSSVINSLKRCRTCDVGAIPGVTKTMKEITLDKHIRLLDSPGVVFAKEGSQATLALKNAINVGTLSDVMLPAEAIIQRVDRTELMTHYKIGEFSTSQELLYLLAKRMGRYKKGGVPDPECAARKLINDWNNGIIKYFTHPPEVYEPMTQISSEIVQEMSKAFDISELEEKMELDKMEELLKNNEIPPNKVDAMEVSDATQQPSAVPKPEITTSLARPANFKKKSQKDKPEQEVSVLKFQKNRQRKRQFKKMKKDRRRNERLATALSDTMNDALSLAI